MEQLHTLEGLALKMNLSTATLRKWIKQGRLNPVRIGQNILRIPESEVQRLLSEAQAVK